MSPISRLIEFASGERGFRWVAFFAFGVPIAVVCGLIFGSDYGNGVWLLVVPCAAIAAYFWVEVMWRTVFRDLYGMRRMAEERKAKETQ